MILPDFKAFPRTGRIIGLDWGARRTGVAVCDARREFVFTRPVVVMGRGANVRGGDGALWARRIAEIVRDENVTGIIVGRPVHTDGGVSETFDNVMRDVAELDAIVSDIPIAFIDENLTSHAAQESMGRVRRDDIKQRLDSESARVILENAIAVINRIRD